MEGVTGSIPVALTMLGLLLRVGSYTTNAATTAASPNAIQVT